MTDCERDLKRLALAKITSLYRDYKSLKAVAYDVELSVSTVSRYIHKKQKPGKMTAYWIISRQ